MCNTHQKAPHTKMRTTKKKCDAKNGKKQARKLNYTFSTFGDGCSNDDSVTTIVKFEL